MNTTPAPYHPAYRAGHVEKSTAAIRTIMLAAFNLDTCGSDAIADIKDRWLSDFDTICNELTRIKGELAPSDMGGDLLTS